jgi:hypothetical protein
MLADRQVLPRIALSLVFVQLNSISARRARWRVPPALLVAALTSILLLAGCVGSADSQHRPSYIRHTAKGAAQRVVLTVEPTHLGKTFALGAVGLSIEAKELATQDLNAGRKSLVALMRLLGPGVLRVGGNSLDFSWWTSDDEQPPVWATSVVTPTDLASLRSLLVVTDWRVILGVDLGHFDPARAANEALVARHILGRRLLGFEIGNEPSNYGLPVIGLRTSSYNASDYLEELAAYSAAMRATMPSIRLYGPDLGSLAPQAWSSQIVADKSTSFVAITQHYYPTSYSFSNGACKATSIPTAAELLSPEVRERENAVLQTIVASGELAHRETRISETNDTSSCDASGGPATSPVFASALWSLDWVLRATSVGVAGLNFHGDFGRCLPEAFAPICTPGYAAAARGQVIARPEYYGLLAARQLEGGRFVPARLISAGPLPNLTTWATVTPGGTVRVAMDNLAATGLPQQVSIPVSGYTATVERLIAPSIGATSGIALGGAAVSGAGRWRPEPTRPPHTRHSVRVVVRPASAVILTLRPKRSRG